MSLFVHTMKQEEFLTVSAAISEVLENAPEMSHSYLQWFQDCDTLEELIEVYNNNRIYDHVRIYETEDDGFVFEYTTRDITESLCIIKAPYSIKAFVVFFTEEESWFSSVVRAFEQEGWELIPDSEEGSGADLDVLMEMSGLQFDDDNEKFVLLNMIGKIGEIL